MHLKKYFKFIFLLVVSYLLSFSNLMADTTCQSLYLDKNKISNIKYIEVKFDNQRKWQKKLARVLDPGLNFNSKIKDKNHFHKISFKTIIKNKKKRQKASIIITYNSGLTCVYKAKIRPHGDSRDHYVIKNGFPLSSMNVHLKNGNIENITKFILLLPLTREGGKDEIFSSILMKNLKILSPRTSFIKVKINNKTFKFIFQEKIVKEFLENNKLTEGPVFKGQENWSKLEKYPDLRPAALTNPLWNKNPDNFNLSLNILSNVNNFYFSDKDKGRCSQMIMNKELLKKKEKENFDEFDLLMKVSNAHHGLGRFNRRIYYDPIYDFFLPVFYDGNVDYDKYGLSKNENNLLVQDPHCINYLNEDSYNNLKDKIKKLDLDSLHNQLKNVGLNDISLSYIKKIIDNLIFRIETLQKISKKNSITKENLIPNNLKQYEKSKKYIDDKLIFYNNLEYKTFNNSIQEFLECKINLKYCKNIYLKRKEIEKLLKQELNNKKNYETLFINNNFAKFKNNSLERKFFGKTNYKYLQIEDINIYYNHNININIDKNNKKISLSQKKSDGRILITDSKLFDWEIDFKNNNNLSLTGDLTKVDNLPGCLTIIDTVVKNLQIKTYNLKCEDSINFFRSNGSVNKTLIEKSYRDGIDADFSNIIFKEIQIVNANNDCIDLSYGNYSIINSNISNCGDKGVSTGENSKLEINQLKITDSSIGIASKDGSHVKATNINIYDTSICFAAYNKKKEFNGSYMHVNKFNCKNFESQTDINTGSIIQFN
jgi:hypothetical protein